MAGTGSGAKVVVYNTRERVVSDDPNRAQSFQAQQLAELLRYMFDAQLEQDITANGVEAMSDGTESPMAATIVNGIRPRPEIGTANLFIEPGAVLLIDNPGPSSDDSLASLVVDPGIQLAGALTMTPGAGSTRFDVVECQRVVNVIESDNRDVFNISTGLFSPVQLTKVQQSQLVYRIRTGTPGAGFPGVAAGWLPLMVAKVPAGATTWDPVICWDVRPLAADRVNAPFRTRRQVAANPRSFIVSDTVTNGAQVRLSGEIDITQRGYLAGGILKKNDSVLYVDITDNTFWQPSFSSFGTNGQIWYLYAVFPFGLPRWVRYTDASTGKRQPGAQRGIPVVSQEWPNFSGLPAANTMQCPNAFGFGDPPGQNAVCIAAGRAAVTAAPPRGIAVDGHVTMLIGNDSPGIAPNSSSDFQATWLLYKDGSGGSQWQGGSVVAVPGNARAAYLRLRGEFTTPSPAPGAEGVANIRSKVLVGDAFGNYSGTATECGLEGSSRSVPFSISPVTIVVEFTVRVPLVQPPTFVYDNTSPLGRFDVVWNYETASSLTKANLTATVLGWETGP